MKPFLVSMTLVLSAAATSSASQDVLPPSGMPGRADAERQTRGATLIVDDDRRECPHAGFRSIQGAVDAAAPGDAINVCPGTYDEQVVIAKPLALTGISRRGGNAAILRPSHMTARATGLSENFLGAAAVPIAAAITVMDSTDVVIENLIVDGASNGVTTCEPDLLAGIYYRNASGSIGASTVKNIRLGSNLGRCPSGIGIYVESGGGASPQVTVRDSSVHDCQLNAMAAVAAGTDFRAWRNVVTGLGDQSGPGHPGIGMGWGARGWIEQNVVTNYVFESCTLTSCPDLGTGILVFFTDDVRIVRNVVGTSHAGIVLQGTTGVRVLDNTVFDSELFDGIAVFGDANVIRENLVTNSDESGIFVSGAGNTIRGNMIHGTPVGLLTTTPYAQADNTFINTAVTQELLAATAAARSTARLGPTRRGRARDHVGGL